MDDTILLTFSTAIFWAFVGLIDELIASIACIARETSAFAFEACPMRAI